MTFHKYFNIVISINNIQIINKKKWILRSNYDVNDIQTPLIEIFCLQLSKKKLRVLVLVI